MDQMRQQVEQHAPQTTGLSRDLQTLKTNASASAGELRQFINSLKGRSPEEMLGAISGSGLVRATAQATVATVVLLVAFTLIPWMWPSDEAGAAQAGSKKSESNATKTETPAPATASKPDSTASTAASAPASGDEPSAANVQKAAQVMKLDEVKQADPKSNPLEKNLDKLLDGVD